MGVTYFGTVPLSPTATEQTAEATAVQHKQDVTPTQLSLLGDRLAFRFIT